MEQALYRRQRPRSFDEVVGQDHIITTLQNAIKSGRISHAYLFTGPRGVGKTSVARILAHEVNGLPYTDESIHLDIIEIDAASNRRIDEIRDLRDRVHISPTSAKYKVYIIDEVHMLTREAFNALLKTLEEPPAHCIFILATTEAHKLPETIISRTQRFEFKPVSVGQIAEHLKNMAKKEKLRIDPEAVELLAEYGEGSFRDSISLLDQLGSSGETVSADEVRDMLGLPATEIVKDLAMALNSGDSSAVLNLLGQLRDHGANASIIAKSLSKVLRQQLAQSNDAKWLVPLLRDLLEVSASSRPQDALEISLLAACLATGPNPTDRPVNTAAVPPAAASPEPKVVPRTSLLSAAKTDNQITTTDQFDLDLWEKVLSAVKAQAASLYTALRLATPLLSGDTLILSFQFPLHRKKVNLAAHKELIAKTIEDLSGQKLVIDCTVSEDLKPPAPAESKLAAQASQNNNPIQTISNIFGGGEVLES